MAKFKSSNKKGLPEISTASLPDIVFMLLFFFMVSTTFREMPMKVQIIKPEATEIKKLEKKSLVSYIYVGKPMLMFQKTYGTEPRIQLNDQFAELTDIADYIESERKTHDESEVPLIWTSLKVDAKAKMGIVSDVKESLKKCYALKLNYSTRRRAEW